MMTIIAILIKLKARNITNKSLPFFLQKYKKSRTTVCILTKKTQLITNAHHL